MPLLKRRAEALVEKELVIEKMMAGKINKSKRPIIKEVVTTYVHTTSKNLEKEKEKVDLSDLGLLLMDSCVMKAIPINVKMPNRCRMMSNPHKIIFEVDSS